LPTDFMMADSKVATGFREILPGFMLGALVGTLTGLSTSPVTKDVVVGVVALVGMFFGLRPKKTESSSDQEEQERAGHQLQTHPLRLTSFCLGCIVAIGFAIRVRDTMSLIPLENRSLAALTIEQRVDRILKADRLLAEVDPEGKIPRDVVLGIEDEQSKDTSWSRKGAVAAPVRAAVPLLRGEAPTRQDSSATTCATYKQLIEEANSGDAAEQLTKIEELTQQYLLDGDWADIGEFVSDQPSHKQGAVLEALTWFRCEGRDP
jgi:hypothetical protein